MEVIRNLNDLKAYVEEKKIGFVPTMGALHEGHLSLMKRSIKENPETLVSIFVNPSQFNDPKDFQKYPQKIEKDLEDCKNAGVTSVFLPTPQEIYPQGFRTSIFPYKTSPEEKILCDKFRPGHFDGVLTVVNILFNLVKPKNAYFGLKDAQQCAYIMNMVNDLHMSLNIVPCETIRDNNDKLALSSRNERLSLEERRIASFIPHFLEAVAHKKITPHQAFQELVQKGIQVEYLEVRSFPSLELKENFSKSDRVFFAGFVGPVRLIDNWEIL